MVISARFSGTRQQSCGRTPTAISTISSVRPISRFMRVCSSGRSACTSRSWMWRRSSRRCSVMLSAPACSASSAACTGSGIRRAARLAHRGHVIDVDAEFDVERSSCDYLAAPSSAPRCACAARGLPDNDPAPGAARGAPRRATRASSSASCCNASRQRPGYAPGALAHFGQALAGPKLVVSPARRPSNSRP